MKAMIRGIMGDRKIKGSVRLELTDNA